MLYFEDFEAGSRRELGSYLVTEEEILSFARQYDPQPFHIDKEAATSSIYGGLISSGWMTCSIMMRLLVLSTTGKSASMGSPGVDEIRWLKPVYAGDTLTVVLNVLDSRPSQSKPDRGVVHTQWEATNQRGELVCTVKGMGMYGRRPA
ncbi:MaoC family dehydratase [Cupriavidus taiwanensis]|uniref:Putative dehydratase, MaoC-like domain n=1 Tax=Cupriavidus taiwanensis TaxID=164546 RepID=A0A375IDR6_9BURK|nr:MaoC family dehydratase [Cupriavidus taiwanensis]SOY56413.1 putative dehydratase, MaoC-like domain [Cupriavidus taiwanensis]SOY57088.1 putative dehydratase, MaoC-like domain [Cupriavidus taiwanensis]SOY79173.1 putative dehydratase, MaoC-like domain [Cupriavidus taiwanensis]SOZ25974.1 putative dehydratase, MaoC-like domain [Cupriavidus taiwanensis]SOZ64577.1 putative dehydratase, MaoC-like domain [Cupriavidus taiwanensis]